MLLKILKPANVPLNDATQFVFQTHQHFVCCAPLDKKRAPETRQLTPELMNESIIRDIDPVLIGEEIINEYRLENEGFIRLRLLFTRAALTSLYGPDGSPIVAINHQLAPQIVMPRQRRRSRSQTDVV